MFRFIDKLSENKSVLKNTAPTDSAQQVEAMDVIQGAHLTEQPMVQSAVEATLSSYYKDEGDELLDLLDKQKIRVLFDEELSGETGKAHFSKNNNTLVLSSQPHDILDMAREMYRVLNRLKAS
jgi:archaellum component FlaG (FlaF/FlaG flagellin family)